MTAPTAAPHPESWRELAGKAFASRSFLIGFVITGAIAAMALVSYLWTPYDITRLIVSDKLQPPSAIHWFGTDHFGRDVASMLMAGAWNSLAIAWPAVLLGAAAGIAVGSAAAALRGLFDEVAMRISDVIFAFPAVLSAIMIGALLGSGPSAAILAIAIFNVPVFARVSRGVALQVWTFDYVAAARSLGKHPLRITLEDVLPNIAGVLVVQVTIQLALAILTEAGLSYLGLGIRPPNPSWGRMLSDAQTYLAQAPHLAIAPGCAIALSVLGLNLLRDGLSDALDPTLRGRNL